MVFNIIPKLAFGLSLLIFIAVSCSEDNHTKINKSLNYEPLLKIVSLRESENNSRLNPFYDKNLVILECTIRNVSNDTLYIHYNQKYKSRIFSNIAFIMLVVDNATNPICENYEKSIFDVNAKVAFPSKQDKTFTLPFAYLRKNEFETSYELITEFWIIVSSQYDISSLFKVGPLNESYRKIKLDDGTIAYHYPLRFNYWIQSNTFFEIAPKY